jgi:tRNA uridine 5-carboxymethylaminomethyl modification enzyme
MQRALQLAEETVLNPDRVTQEWCGITSQTTIARLMQRADFDIAEFAAAAGGVLPHVSSAFEALTDEERDDVVSAMRYAGYIARQQREAEKACQDEEVSIPTAMTYALPGLSREVVEKLSRLQPRSLGQASRIPGVTPAAISILRMHLRQKRHDARSAAAAV